MSVHIERRITSGLPPTIATAKNSSEVESARLFELEFQFTSAVGRLDAVYIGGNVLWLAGDYVLCQVSG